MQLGPYLHPNIRDVRRMASEDSHQIDESFLLIFCTGRIVTASHCGTARYTGFPAYGRMYYRVVTGAGGSLFPTLGPL